MYSKHLRKLAILDLSLILILSIARIIYLTLQEVHMPYIAIATGICFAWVVVKIILSGKKHEEFRDIWHNSYERILPSSLYALTAFILCQAFDMDHEAFANWLYILLLGYVDYRYDSQAYRRALLFKIDEVKTLKELVEKHPAVKQLLSKSALKKLEAAET